MSAVVEWTEDVRPEWIDYNGHVSEPYYVLVFGHATDEVMRRIGLPPEDVVATGASLYTVEAHVRYLDQVPPGATLHVRSSIIGCGAKTLWLWHEMWVQGRLRATEEILGLHVVTDAGTRARAFPPAVVARIEPLTVSPPDEAGRRIRVR
ncbi:thioesterase family protein [Agilicoccus flavus]|uniref:thioesterase family protein n=1 Tax=Agilicoccus flavus TaxID=2775968 RepID=UPI001CF638F4|nr:thioesterase family protein [Agilicoccus flavus]